MRRLATGDRIVAMSGICRTTGFESFRFRERYSRRKQLAPLAAAHAKAHVDMSIDSGQVTLKFPSRAPIMFRTKLGDVSPYASVSSSTAVFSVGP